MYHYITTLWPTSIFVILSTSQHNYSDWYACEYTTFYLLFLFFAKKIGTKIRFSHFNTYFISKIFTICQSNTIKQNIRKSPPIISFRNIGGEQLREFLTEDFVFMQIYDGVQKIGIIIAAFLHFLTIRLLTFRNCIETS